MKKLLALASVALLSLSMTGCAPSYRVNDGANAAGLRGAGNVKANASVRWKAKARCSATGARGYSSGERSASDAAAKAVAMCIQRGGIPACCSVRELSPYHVN